MLKVLNLKRYSHRPFYESRWCVETNQGFVGRIVRPDSETEKHLTKLIEQCGDIFEVSHLDMLEGKLFG